MKTITFTYWASTALLALFMSFSAYLYLTAPDIKQGFYHLGFPDYFRIELAIAKFIGAIVLLAPVPDRIKEWAYAGFGITFVSAFIAHRVVGDPVMTSLAPLIMLLLLIVSYSTYHKKHKAAQSYPHAKASLAS